MNTKLYNGVLAAKKRVDTLIEHMAQNGVRCKRTDGVWDVSETSAARFIGKGDAAVEHMEGYTVVLYCSMFGDAAFYEWALPDIDLLLQNINATIESWEKQMYARWPKQKETHVA